MKPLPQPARPALPRGQRHDLRVAAAQMRGAARRAGQAQRALPYGAGSARRAEPLCGGSRDAVEVGLAAHRTGIVGLGAPATAWGRTRWEAQSPAVAHALQPLAAAHAQYAPTVRTTRASTRLTAPAASDTLCVHGGAEEQRPAPRPMAAVRHRLGERWRTVVQATPHKKSPATDAIGATRNTRPAGSGHGAGQTRAHGLESHGAYGRVRTRRADPRP